MGGVHVSTTSLPPHPARAPARAIATSGVPSLLHKSMTPLPGPDGPLLIEQRRNRAQALHSPGERCHRDRAGAPVPHRPGGLPGPPGAPAALRRLRPAGRGELLGLLPVRDRGEPGPLRAGRERARPRAAPRPALQQDGRGVARLRRGARPRGRVRLPGRLRGQPQPAPAALRPPEGPHRPLLEVGGGARAVGRGGGGEGPARAPALPGRGRGVRLGPRAPPRRAPRRLGHLRAARAGLHAAPERRGGAPRHVPRPRARRSPT